jgi:AAA domain
MLLLTSSTAEVKAKQVARLDIEEARTLQQLHKTTMEQQPIRQQAVAAEFIAYAREHLFERVSVARDYELQTEALRHGRGRVELADVKAALSAEVASGAMLTARGELATQESLERERQMVAAVNSGINQYRPVGRSGGFVVSDRLRTEQKVAVRAVLDSQDLAINLRGAAGTGKTATLQELHRGLMESRQSMLAVAPTASAAEELRKVGFTQAMTVARLLADPQQRHELAGQVLIVDEAGMVSSKDMAELIKLAKTKSADLC